MRLYYSRNLSYNYLVEKRVFISVDLPTEVKNYLKGLQNRGIYWMKWIRAENLHMTLNFLGYLNASEIAEASEILKDLAAACSPFNLSLSKFKTHRDMLWLIPDKNDSLLNLQGDLKGRLEEAGLVKRERRGFSPHILFAKSKTGRRLAWQPENLTLQKFLVDRVNLYESRLTPGAATHILIQSFVLGGDPSLRDIPKIPKEFLEQPRPDEGREGL